MPEPVETLGGAVKHKDAIEITWEFKANLSDLPPGGIHLEAPESVPLPGSWQLNVDKDEDDPGVLSVDATYGSLPLGSLGSSVTVKLDFSLIAGAGKRRLNGASWDDGSEPSLAATGYESYNCYRVSLSRKELAANGRWPASEQNSVQQYCFTITFVRQLQRNTAQRHRAPTDDVTKALCMAGKSTPLIFCRYLSQMTAESVSFAH